MNDLTLLIPAKNESESLPIVLEEIKNYQLKKLVVMEEEDKTTFNSIKGFDCDVLIQKIKVMDQQLLKDLKMLKMNLVVYLMLIIHLIQNILTD